jgi:hypothetical protein
LAVFDGARGVGVGGGGEAGADDGGGEAGENKSSNGRFQGFLPLCSF